MSEEFPDEGLAQLNVLPLSLSEAQFEHFTTQSFKVLF